VSTRWCIESEVYNPEYSRFLGNMERVFYYWHYCGERFFKKYAQAQFEGKIPLRYHNRINDWLNGIPYDQTRNNTPAIFSLLSKPLTVMSFILMSANAMLQAFRKDIEIAISDADHVLYRVMTVLNEN